MIENEVRAIWALFVIAFLAVAVWESRRPRRQLVSPTERRWAAHGILLFGGGIFQSLLLRLTPAGFAMAAAGSAWGRWQDAHVPWAARWIVALLALDLVRYVTHRCFHAVGALWRIHEVHHSDRDFDVSTAGRFHPLEVLLGKALYVGAIVMLAAPPVAVIAAELLTDLLNVVSHANASLPPPVEAVVRRVFITPDLHRIHHSLSMAEQNRNFGQALVFWDRLFGTFQPYSAHGAAMATGVEGNAGSNRLWDLVADPFRAKS